MTASAQLQTFAIQLWEAESGCQPCEPLTAQHTVSLDDAYAIQEINIRRRLAHGATIVGHKVGLTSRAVQEWLGVDQPDFGHLLDDMAIAEGGVVPTSSLLQPRVEGEMAFVLGEDLPKSGVTAARVILATAFVLPAIEIIDSRIRDWAIKGPDTIADNGSAALFVLGGTPVALNGLDLRMAGLALRKNGEVVSTGAGAACLGHPAQAVAWLANTLGALGTPLKRGHIVLSGALGPVSPVVAGDHVEVEVAHLGRVAVRFG